MFTPSTIFVEAFGKMVPDGDIDAREEDLYSVFNSRSEMMGLSGTLAPGSGRPQLWGMNEAELSVDSEGKLIEVLSGRVGYVQVDSEFDAIPILPPLLQCFGDALARFGTLELTAVQVTVGALKPYTQLGFRDLNWFNLRRPDLRACSLVACSQELLGGGSMADLAGGGELSRLRGGFLYGAAIKTPDGSCVVMPPEAVYSIPVSPGLEGLCIPVELPEWTFSAAAWAIALLVEAVRVRNRDVRNLAVRVTRASY